MADQNADVFGDTIRSAGFAERFSATLRPPTREDRLTALDASRESVDAAKAKAVAGVFGTPTPAASTAAVPDKEALKEMFSKLSPEELSAASDAIIDVEIDRGAFASGDEWDGEDV